MRKNIFKINFNGNIGTGVLLNLFEDGYGIIDDHQSGKTGCD